MYYVGVDTHKVNSFLTIISGDGDIVRQKQIRTSRQAFSEALGECAEPLKACLEAGYNWGPVYDWLDELCDETILAHPARVRLIGESMIKTDKIDSAILAHLLRAGLIPRAHACSAGEREKKRVLRRRMFLVVLRTMVKNRVHSLLTQHSVERPAVSDLFGKAGMAWLRRLDWPSVDGDLLSGDLLLLEQINEHIAVSEALIKELSRGDRVVGRLRSIPGIGKFFSVLIALEIGDIGRFSSDKKLAAYCGLVPSTYSSGGRTRHGRLIKAGNKWLRYAFVEAVSPAIRRAAELRDYYQQIRDRRGVKAARVATARKLSSIVWYVWSQERRYEYR